MLPGRRPWVAAGSVRKRREGTAREPNGRCFDAPLARWGWGKGATETRQNEVRAAREELRVSSR
eukprot:2732983-Lingulodinium_polyedra.AAC.1